jgi:hypothetical protein
MDIQATIKIENKQVFLVSTVVSKRGRYTAEELICNEADFDLQRATVLAKLQTQLRQDMLFQNYYNQLSQLGIQKINALTGYAP